MGILPVKNLTDKIWAVLCSLQTLVILTLLAFTAPKMAYNRSVFILVVAISLQCIFSILALMKMIATEKVNVGLKKREKDLFFLNDLLAKYTNAFMEVEHGTRMMDIRPERIWDFKQTGYAAVSAPGVNAKQDIFHQLQQVSRLQQKILRPTKEHCNCNVLLHRCMRKVEPLVGQHTIILQLNNTIGSIDMDRISFELAVDMILKSIVTGSYKEPLTVLITLEKKMKAQCIIFKGNPTIFSRAGFIALLKDNPDMDPSNYEPDMRLAILEAYLRINNGSIRFQEDRQGSKVILLFEEAAKATIKNFISF